MKNEICVLGLYKVVETGNHIFTITKENEYIVNYYWLDKPDDVKSIARDDIESYLDSGEIVRIQ